jgi:hypothetical protein
MMPAGLHFQRMKRRWVALAFFVLGLELLGGFFFYFKPAFFGYSTRNYLPFVVHVLAGFAVGTVCYPDKLATALTATVAGLAAAALVGLTHYIAGRLKVPVDMPGASGAILLAFASTFLIVPLTGFGAVIGYLLRRG